MATTVGTRKRGRKARVEVGADEAQRTLGRLINRAAVGDERFVITRHGLHAAAIISIDDLKKLEASEAA